MGAMGCHGNLDFDPTVLGCRRRCTPGVAWRHVLMCEHEAEVRRTTVVAAMRNHCLQPVSLHKKGRKKPVVASSAAQGYESLTWFQRTSRSPQEHARAPGCPPTSSHVVLHSRSAALPRPGSPEGLS
eukprot:347016-Chlamydomonas_euryale.AAC.8